MSKQSHLKGLLFFCLKFLVLVTVLVVVWWLAIPAYGYLLIQVTGGVLKGVMGVAIEAGRIETGGVLNTDSLLVFVHDGGIASKMPIALLVTNLPPYWALVLATAGLRWRRRLAILGYGSAILVFSHVLHIVVVLKYGAVLQRVSEVPTAVAQFYLTLPFLLWIVLAYWDRIGALLGENDGGDGPSD